MKRIKFLLVCITVTLCMTPVNAAGEGREMDYKPYPHMFVGVNAGAQVSFTNYDFSKLITPVYGVSFGGYFNPVVGARLHVSGFQNKGGIKSLNETYDYNYLTGSADLLVNVTNMFRKNKDGVFDFILLAGVGLQGAWNNDDFHALAARTSEVYPFGWGDNRLSHNLRLGMQFDFDITKHFGMNLELAANNMSDHINSKTCNRDDWSATASIGLVYKFGFKKKPVVAEEPIQVEEWATRVDTVWYDEVTHKQVVETMKLEEEFYYGIRLTEPEPASKIETIAKFVKEHKNGKLHVVAYADKGTGTAKVNMEYSKVRAEKVVAALVEAGVDKSMITFEYKGDTVQPFAENDKNRVAIVTVTGEAVKDVPVTTKKYRTQENRYRVK